MKKTGQEKGITLIALIITIVVLLILAVVAIRAVQGDGIIQYARNARNDYEQAQANELTQLQNYIDIITDNDSANKLNPALNPIGKIPEGASYMTASGNLLEADEKFPETITESDIYSYGDYVYTYQTDKKGWSVTINNSVTDKKQIGYGAILESINDIPITNVIGLFNECINLITPPNIPDSVTIMSGAFAECKSLTTAPKIPSSVKTMNSTFANCVSLKTYVGSKDSDGDFSKYIIPSGVKEMNAIFFNCSAITIAPNIPESVEQMNSAFGNCTSLIEMPTIPNGIPSSMYGEIFAGCTQFGY